MREIPKIKYPTNTPEVQQDAALPQPDFYHVPSFEEFRSLSEQYFASLDKHKIIQLALDQNFDGARWHPSGGFFVFYLSDARTRPNGQLRLHVWPEGIERRYSDLHFHPWHLASLVVTGSYSEKTAERGAPGDNTDYTFYNSFQNPDNPSDYTVTPREPAFFQLSESQQYGAGSTHYLEKGRYHLTDFNNMAITLCIAGKSDIHSDFARHRGFQPLIKPDHTSVMKQLQHLKD